MKRTAIQRSWMKLAALLFIGASVGLAAETDSYSTAGEWRQWGGPGRNFISSSKELADLWPSGGPRVIWSRPLGHGHSAITFDQSRLFTMYRPGRAASRTTAWESRERVIAMDAATGNTLWEYEYASEPLNFTYGAGPHATPLVVQDLLFTAGTNKQIHALDKKTGRVVWSHDLVKEYGAPPTLIRPAVKAGYASSPIAYNDTVIVVAGGKGQSVMSFRQKDGALVWKTGDFIVAEAASLIIDVDGQKQLVVVGGQTINGLNPEDGKILWSFAHDTDGDMNNSTPIWGPDNVLIVSSAYDQGTRALKLTREQGTTRADQVWFTSRFKLMFANAIRIDDYLYGTHGDFGPAFLAALNVKTGQIAWQTRGYGRSSLVWADGKTLVLDEDGQLRLVRLTPEGATVLASAQIFNTTSWTAPTLMGGTLYARDREKIVALDVGKH
ncbi:MAG TPA: PQQ-binding-like beta-propeller repeat protein [Terriglobia bacterium]|nr:PQQ-binding-like beta-propeller repeat protein [Terriglobia bacterium]